MNSCTKTPETSEQINPIHNHSTLLRSHPRPNTRTLSRAMTAVRNAFSFIPDCVGDAAGAGPWVEKAISDDRRLAMGTAPFPDPKKIVDPLVKASQCEPCSIVCTERGGADCCCNIPISLIDPCKGVLSVIACFRQSMPTSTRPKPSRLNCQGLKDRENPLEKTVCVRCLQF